MEKETFLSSAADASSERFACQPPLLFSIPAHYEDALVERNRSYYLKMQRIEKKYEKIRKEMLKYVRRQDLKSKQTQEMVERARYMLDKFRTQKEVQLTYRRALNASL